MRILGKLIAFFIFFIILIYSFVYSGIYNVAAIKADPKPFIWLFNNTKENSVRFCSKGIKVPNLDDESLILSGFEHYDQMCVSCPMLLNPLFRLKF